MADGPLLSALQSQGAPAKTLPGLTSIFGAPIARPALQANGLLSGNIWTPFASKKPESAQLAFEQQVTAAVRAEGDKLLSQGVQQASAFQQGTGSIHGGGGFVAMAGPSMGGDFGVA